MGEQEGLMDVNMIYRLPFLSKKENDTFSPASKVKREVLNLTEKNCIPIVRVPECL